MYCLYDDFLKVLHLKEVRTKHNVYIRQSVIEYRNPILQYPTNFIVNLEKQNRNLRIITECSIYCIQSRLRKWNSWSLPLRLIFHLCEFHLTDLNYIYTKLRRFAREPQIATTKTNIPLIRFLLRRSYGNNRNVLIVTIFGNSIRHGNTVACQAKRYHVWKQLPSILKM